MKRTLRRGTTATLNIYISKLGPGNLGSSVGGPGGEFDRRPMQSAARCCCSQTLTRGRRQLGGVSEQTAACGQCYSRQSGVIPVCDPTCVHLPLPCLAWPWLALQAHSTMMVWSCLMPPCQEGPGRASTWVRGFWGFGGRLDGQLTRIRHSNCMTCAAGLSGPSITVCCTLIRQCVLLGSYTLHTYSLLTVPVSVLCCCLQVRQQPMRYMNPSRAVLGFRCLDCDAGLYLHVVWRTAIVLQTACRHADSAELTLMRACVFVLLCRLGTECLWFTHSG
jgi:hypothetical protein